LVQRGPDGEEDVRRRRPDILSRGHTAMKQKIQLIRCPIDDVSIGADQWNMPLDLLLVANAVDKRCDVEIIDGTLHGLDGVIRRLDPTAGIVGLTYTALSAHSLRSLAEHCKANGSFVAWRTARHCSRRFTCFREHH